MEVIHYEIPDPPARRPKVSIACAGQGSQVLIQQRAHADRFAGFLGKMHGYRASSPSQASVA